MKRSLSFLCRAVFSLFVIFSLLAPALWAQDSLNVRLVGSYDTPSRAWDVSVSGNYAYVADGDSGLRIIDISNPSSPSEVSAYREPGSWRVTVFGNYAYVADLKILRIVDISNPYSPFEVGSYNSPGIIHEISISGSYAYLADELDGIRIVDISNPNSPFEVGFYDTSGVVYGIAVSGNYAYVANFGQGLLILNITNPASPFQVGIHDTPLPGFAHGVAVSG
ncbi:hypothetical protein IIA15_00740, partial [candidate division TA06 bacterium]|nr:hypothetical protein [candidate division TA06 bacterium]